jgi:hypothetical protein
VSFSGKRWSQLNLRFLPWKHIDTLFNGRYEAIATVTYGFDTPLVSAIIANGPPSCDDTTS